MVEDEPSEDPGADTRPRPKENGPIVARPLDEVREQRGEKLVAVRRSWILGLKAYRRLHADRILGAIGLVVLMVAAILIFMWENPPEPEPEWPVVWEERLHATEINATGTYLAEPAQFTPPGQDPPQQEQTYTFTISETNVTRVQVLFSALDDVGNEPPFVAADKFNVTVEGPPGANVSLVRQPAPNVTATWHENITIFLNPIPTVVSAPAETEEEARAYVARQVNATTMGQGEWTVRIRMIEALDAWADGSNGNDCNAILAAGQQCTPDDGNTFELTVRYFSFYPTYPPPEE